MKRLAQLLALSLPFVLAVPAALGQVYLDPTPDSPDEEEGIYEGEKPYIPLDPKDPYYNIWRQLRDDFVFNTSDLESERKPGPINVQRFAGHYNWIGIPTFFRLPVALTPEDLEAGKVDVAIMGAESAGDARARSYGPAEMRNPRNQQYIGWGKMLSGSMHTLINPFDVLNVVDYGDAPNEPMSVYRTVNEVRKYVRDIAGVQFEDSEGVTRHTIPFIVGGSHALEFPNVAALTDVYGKGNVGVIHFDAHADTTSGGFGHTYTHGNPVYRLIEDGYVDGKNYIQVGLRGYYMDEDGLAWMRKHRMRYHTMVEIEKRGWDAVLEDVIDEAQDGAEYLHISFDIDVVDPSYMPGTYTPEPGGITTIQAMTVVRRLCAESNVVGFDIVELKPESDPTYRTIQAASRILHSCLDGVALRRKGITEPDYRHPETVDDGSNLEQLPEGDKE